MKRSQSESIGSTYMCKDTHVAYTGIPLKHKTRKHYIYKQHRHLKQFKKIHGKNHKEIPTASISCH